MSSQKPKTQLISNLDKIKETTAKKENPNQDQNGSNIKRKNKFQIKQSPPKTRYKTTANNNKNVKTE